MRAKLKLLCLDMQMLPKHALHLVIDVNRKEMDSDLQLVCLEKLVLQQTVLKEDLR